MITPTVEVANRINIPRQLRKCVVRCLKQPTIPRTVKSSVTAVRARDGGGSGARLNAVCQSQYSTKFPSWMKSGACLGQRGATEYCRRINTSLNAVSVEGLP